MTSTPTFTGFCPRCGNVVGTWHSKAACDAAYDATYRAAMPPVPERFPRVQGVCPACGGRSLFLGEGGYVTCSRTDCTDPTAPTDLLDGAR